MSRAPARPSVPAPDVPLLVSLYALEISALLLTVALHKRVVARSLLSPDVAIFLIACLALVGAAALMIRRWRRASPRPLVFTVVLNGVTTPRPGMPR